MEVCISRQVGTYKTLCSTPLYGESLLKWKERTVQMSKKTPLQLTCRLWCTRASSLLTRQYSSRMCTAKLVNNRSFSSHKTAAPVEGPQVDKFEKVFSLGHQMSNEFPCPEGGGRLRVGSLYGEVQWVQWLIDRHDWKHYLPATSLAGGDNVRKKRTGSLFHCNPRLDLELYEKNQNNG